MNSYRNDICDMFPEHALKAVNLFCNEINNSNADVFVVMAHKAVLLLQILVDQNYISTDVINNKLLITNHALDFNCNYLKGKRVAIIDDIVISGTCLIFRSTAIKSNGAYIWSGEIFRWIIR